MVRRKPRDGQLGFELPETPGMNPNYLPPLDIIDDRTPEQLKRDGDDKWPDGTRYVIPRRTLAQEIKVREGFYTGARPEYHPELDGPLDSVYGAGGAPPSDPSAPPQADEPEDDDDGEPDFSEPEDSGEDSPVERRGQPRPDQPETSLAAHESVKKNGQYERIWGYLRSRGEGGATSDEVDAIEQPGATVAASRRFSEMRRLGMIRRTHEERPTRSGRKAFVHVAVPRDQWVPLYPEPADEYIHIPAREIENHNNCRLALAKMMAAYGNCDIPGAIMNLAHKPEAPEGAPAGISERDICEVAMFQAWLLGCKALGITLTPNRG